MVVKLKEDLVESSRTQQNSIDSTLERQSVRRFDWIILPAAFLFTFLSHLDRSNLGNARVAGLQESLGISDHQFSIALTVTFVPYIAAEVPVNLLLKKVGANLVIPLLVTLWGIVTTFQGFVSNYQGLLACRFFLGAVEGGLYPAIVLYVSNSYQRHEIQIRIAFFSAAAALSGALSGLLAYWLMELDGVCSIPGWGWIFIIEGMFTTLCGLLGFLVFPRSASTCRLLTPDQRRVMALRLEHSNPLQSREIEEEFSWYQVFCAFKSPHVLLVAGSLFMIGSNLYGLAYFEPSIVKTFGYSPRMTQLISVPPFAIGFIAMLFTSYLSDRYHARGITAITMACLAFIGYALFLTSTSNITRYISLFLSTAGIYSVSPTMYAWIANNSAPHYRKATAIALGPVAANSGGILSPWLFSSASQPEYHTATLVNLSFSLGIVLLCSINLMWLKYCNKKKAVRESKATMWSHEEESIIEEDRKLEDRLRLGDKSESFIYAY